jgi:hypothetical protein
MAQRQRLRRQQRQQRLQLLRLQLDLHDVVKQQRDLPANPNRPTKQALLA